MVWIHHNVNSISLKSLAKVQAVLKPQLEIMNLGGMVVGVKHIKQSIDQRYKWGSVKMNAYRHAGTDLEIVNDPSLGRCLVVHQSYYVETLQDIDIQPERFCQGDATLTPKEIRNISRSFAVAGSADTTTDLRALQFADHRTCWLTGDAHCPGDPAGA